MSKAEDLAEKLYPKKEHVAFGPFPCEEPSVFDDNKPYRIGFISGYHQAEKDLALTVEDIKTIDRLLNRCVDCSNSYQEVLNRFREKKGK